MSWAEVFKFKEAKIRIVSSSEYAGESITVYRDGDELKTVTLDDNGSATVNVSPHATFFISLPNTTICSEEFGMSNGEYKIIDLKDN